MQIVINTSYGNFSLSPKALSLYAHFKDMKEEDIDYNTISRNDPSLIRLVEMLGPNVNGPNVNLKIEQIPDGTEWKIEKLNGMEWIV